MKQALLAFLFLFAFTSPVYSESARNLCAEEARDAGVQDQEELEYYIKECVLQYPAEMESGDADTEAGVDAENNPSEPPSTAEI